MFPQGNKILIKKPACPICKSEYVYLCLRCTNKYNTVKEETAIIKEESSSASKSNCPLPDSSEIFRYFWKATLFIILLYNTDLEKILQFKLLPSSVKNLTHLIQYFSGRILTAMDKSETKSVPSASSIKSRKSTNLISSLIRRTRRKKAAARSIENLQGSGFTFDLEANSTSSFGAGNDPEAGMSEAKDSMLINIIELQEAHEERSDEIDSELGSPKAMPRSIIAGRRVTRCFSAEANQQCFADMVHLETVRTRTSLEDLNDNINSGESAANKSTYTQSSNRDVYNDLVTSKIAAAPTTVLHFGKPCIDATLCDGIHYVQEIITNLVQSEQHVIQLIKKHIYDSSFQKELLEALQQHSKLQWEAERRANALNNDMWVQQVEITRAQERSLQETLNSLVRQNRQLQLENENLSRKNERMSSRLRLYPEYSPRNRSLDLNNSVVGKLTKGNERLQGKVEAYMQQVEMLEKDVKVSQKQNESLEHYARNLQAQIQNLKAMLQRSKADYELEQASLSHQLQTNQDILKEGIETGDVVLEDLEAVRRRMKDMPFDINWTKFKIPSVLVELRKKVKNGEVFSDPQRIK